MWLILGRKTFFCYICPLLKVCLKKVVQTNPNFSQYLPLFKHVKKNKLCEYFVLLSGIATFWLKREFFCEYPQKYFKTTEKHCLAVCGSLWGEQLFFLIFLPIYWFDQIQLFKQIQILLRICPFSNLLRKKNLSEYFCVLFRDSHFWTKKRSFQWICPKLLQNNRKAKFRCMGLIFWRKTVFVNIWPLLLFWTKTIV